MAEGADLKEKVLTFEDKVEKNFKDKKLWELMTGEGGKFSCWSAEIAAAIVVGEEVKVRYEIKKTEKYTNFIIKAVAKQSESGTWGEWLEEKKWAGKAGGFKAFDGEGANKRTCLQAAATIIAAQVAKAPAASNAVALASVLDMTAKLMTGVFGPAKVAPEPAKAVVPAVKKASIVDAIDSPQDLEESVPF